MDLTQTIFAYPNPFRPSTDFEIRFVNVPPETGLIIMTASGEVVRELVNQGQSQAEVVWDGCNKYGDTVAIGVYPWYTKESGASGKLIIVP